MKLFGWQVPPWLRTTLVILWKTARTLFVPAICVVALLVGLMVGYSMVGDGSASDVLKWSTWKHLYDLVFEGT